MVEREFRKLKVPSSILGRGRLTFMNHIVILWLISDGQHQEAEMPDLLLACTGLCDERANLLHGDRLSSTITYQPIHCNMCDPAEGTYINTMLQNFSI